MPFEVLNLATEEDGIQLALNTTFIFCVLCGDE